MKQNQHITAFKRFDNELGYIKCVISGDDAKAFESIGFVFSVDNLDSEQEELDRLVNLRDKAKKLKIKGWQKMSEPTLAKKIEEYEDNQNISH